MTNGSKRQRRSGATPESLAPGPSETSSRFIQISKWGGCFTALVFAVTGLLCDIARLNDTVETLGRRSWIVVAIAMAFGLAGVLLDRSYGSPTSSDPASNDRSRGPRRTAGPSRARDAGRESGGAAPLSPGGSHHP